MSSERNNITDHVTITCPDCNGALGKTRENCGRCKGAGIILAKKGSEDHDRGIAAEALQALLELFKKKKK